MPMQQSNKHAFLILAHTQPKLLKRLLNRLDHRNVDIFLRLDRKSVFNEKELTESVKYSNLYLTRRLPVTWGGYSMIQAELVLLEKATSTGNYKYYHLLSGQDYLLQSIDNILSYYDKTPDINYISYKEDEVLCFIDRLRLTFPFQDLIGRTRGGLYYLQRIFNIIQKAFKLYRTIPDSIGYGSQFFDITDDFARWIIKKQANWEHIFKNTECGDEMYVQTLYLFYTKEKHAKLCCQIESDFNTFDRAGLSIKRAIDWKRGRPYVWREKDFMMLKTTQLLFVRKVDETKSKDLLNLLDKTANQTLSV